MLSNMFRLQKWRPIPTKSHEDDAEESFMGHNGINNKIVPKKRSNFLTVCLTLVNLTALGLSIFLYYSHGRSSTPAGKNSTLKQFAAYSPILDDIELPTFPVKFNGTLLPSKNPSWARSPPTPEVDAAWSFFERVRTHVLTKEEVIKLGKNPDTAAKFEEKYWGFGPDAYMAQMDSMHQIHCLNLLRKAAYADYPGQKSTEAKDNMYWIHLGHCTDMILQNIMCTATTDLLTLKWAERREKPWPDFSVVHQCRDFDALVKWQHENSVDPEKFDAMKKPEDAVEIPAPWEYHEPYPEGKGREED